MPDVCSDIGVLNEWQWADWKIHKKTVHSPGKIWNETIWERHTDTPSILCNAVSCYLGPNSESVCESWLTKNDILVELDYGPDANVIVPAMRDETEFKIAPVKDYPEESRPAEPDWSARNTARDTTRRLKCTCASWNICTANCFPAIQAELRFVNFGCKL